MERPAHGRVARERWQARRGPGQFRSHRRRVRRRVLWVCVPFHPLHVPCVRGEPTLKLTWLAPLRYTYSLVFAADMYATVFKQDPLDPALGQRYRESILKPGGSREETDSLKVGCCVLDGEEWALICGVAMIDTGVPRTAIELGCVLEGAVWELWGECEFVRGGAVELRGILYGYKDTILGLFLRRIGVCERAGSPRRAKMEALLANAEKRNVMCSRAGLARGAYRHWTRVRVRQPEPHHRRAKSRKCEPMSSDADHGGWGKRRRGDGVPDVSVHAAWL